MLSKKKKQNIIKKHQQSSGDTGSTEVQIALLSAEIAELAEHLQRHHKDHSSRRGLLKKVGERRRLLRYLKKENFESYKELVKSLDLKEARDFKKNTANNADQKGGDSDLEDDFDDIDDSNE